MRDQFLMSMDQQLRGFFEKIEADFSIPKGEIWKRWSGEVVEEKKPAKEVKKSRYQVFFSIQRSLLMKKNPSMTFGDISKKVSEMWKLMSPSEKLKYAQTATLEIPCDVKKINFPAPQAPPPVAIVSVPTVIPVEYDKRKSELQKMSMKSLRIVYNEKNLPQKYNNKNALLEAILEDEFEGRNPVIIPPTIATTQNKPILNEGGRSNLEFALDDEKETRNDDEEEDFYFETDLDDSDEISNNNDDDDQDMIEEMNDNEIFGDDD